MALIIDRPILELLQIESDTPLEISTDGESLIVSPVRPDSESAERKRKVRTPWLRSWRRRPGTVLS